MKIIIAIIAFAATIATASAQYLNNKVAEGWEQMAKEAEKKF
jgi:hypothetical protein